MSALPACGTGRDVFIISVCQAHSAGAEASLVLAVQFSGEAFRVPSAERLGPGDQCGAAVSAGLQLHLRSLAGH